LLFGTIDTWLLHRLSGGSVHMTDATNASRTLLLNLETGEWDRELLEIFGVPAACLPEVRSSSEVYAHTKGLDFLPDGIPISGIAGDQQAALFGQGCLEAGEAKVTFGTGAFILMHTGKRRVVSTHGLLTSIALKLRGDTYYCLEGSAFMAGAAVQWLRDGLGIIKDTADVEALASQVPDSGEVIFVPALAGLGAPYWKPDARGLLSGVSRGTSQAHIARAVLEGVALQNADIIDAMNKDGVVLKVLKVDGGAAANNLLMQMQADYVNVRCARPANVEATGLGAAVLAGLGCGFFKDPQEVRSAWKAERVFEPQMPAALRQDRIAKWHAAVAKA
jgi:glycerol kinase